MGARGEARSKKNLERGARFEPAEAGSPPTKVGGFHPLRAHNRETALALRSQLI
jgi:hypothetical protein